MLVTAGRAFLESEAIANATEDDDGAQPRRWAWTDDYSNVFRILK